MKRYEASTRTKKELFSCQHKCSLHNFSFQVARFMLLFFLALKQIFFLFFCIISLNKSEVETQSFRFEQGN